MVGETEGKSEITAIPSRYKNTLNDLINSSDTEFLDRLESLDLPESLNWLESPNWPESLDRLEPINKGTRNALRSKRALSTLLEEDDLDEYISVTSLKLALQTQDS